MPGHTLSDAVVAVIGASGKDTIAQAAKDTHGRLDGIINAAGVVAFGTLEDTDDAIIEELFMTNVIGPLWLMRRLTPLLRESDGFVVNISAIVAEKPTAGMAAYSATKAALTAADQAMGRELRKTGIDVYDVRPPHTETGLVDRALSGEAPKLPEGLAPEATAKRIVDAIEAGQFDVTASDFSS